MNKIIKFLIISISILFVLLSALCIIFSHYYEQLNYKTEDEISNNASNEEIVKILEEEKDDSAINSNEKEIEDLKENVINNINKVSNELLENEKEKIKANKPNVTNILLIGTDGRNKNKSFSRSDSMMVLSINDDTKKIVLTSVLRDIYVEIPEHGGNRLNTSYAFGGVKLLKETLKNNLNINIDRYAMVNFYDFIEIIDKVGGVEINITEEEMKYINIFLNEINILEGNELEKDYLNTYGNILLNGHQALAYSRIRFIGTDFGRTERQRKVLETLFNNIKNSDISKLNELYFKIAPNVTTDIEENEILELLVNMINFKDYKFEKHCIPFEDSYDFYTIDKMSVIGINFDSNIKKFHEIIYN